MKYVRPNGDTIAINEAKGNWYHEMHIDESGSFGPGCGVIIKTKTRSTGVMIDKLLDLGINPKHIRIDGVPCRIWKFLGKGPMQYNLGMFLYGKDRDTSTDDSVPHYNIQSEE